MSLKPFIKILVFLLFLSNCTFAATNNSLGVVHIQVSENNPSAKAYFLQGLLLLHSFQYEDAKAAFESAQKIDPSFAMAYWGEAMTYNHPLWNEQNYTLATSALMKLAPTAQERLEKAPTEQEKGFINAVNQLYGTGSKLKRDLAYKMAMDNLYKQFPDNEEAGIFYALSILGSKQGTRDFRAYMQAAGILEELYQKNPNHPGIIHYLIHSYDDPIHAPLGLRFARKYDKVSPAAPHALHMPAHIYLALGLWNDVINSDLAAWNAGVAQKEKTGQYDIHALHALHWLSYGYLQLNEKDKAYNNVKTMEKIVLNSNDAMSKWYYSLMRAVYISDTQDWNADLQDIDLTGIEISAVANDAYIKGMQAINSGNTLQVKKIIDKVYQLSRLSPTHSHSAAPHHDSNYFNTINAEGIIIAKIIYLELMAQNAEAQGHSQEAIKFTKQASDIENSLNFGYGPPTLIKPANELLAELYFKNKLYELACRQFTIALEHTPNRRISREGLEKSMKKLNLPLSSSPN